MVRPVSAILKSFTRKLTGKTGEPKLRGMIDTKSLRSAYEVLIRHKQDNIQQYKHAVGMLLAHVNKIKCSEQNVTADIDKLKNLLLEVKKKINTLTVELQQTGKSQEEIEQHPDCIQFQADYNAIQSDLDEKNSRFTKLQQDIKKVEYKIELFKVHIQQLHRAMDRIQEEQDDTIHDHLSILKDKEIADVLAGIR